MFSLVQLEDGRYRLRIELNYPNGDSDRLDWVVQRTQSDAPEKSGGTKIERKFADE